MTISISSALLDELGFHQYPENKTVAGVFHCLLVYAAQGFVIEGKPPPPARGSFGEISYDVVVGSNINEMCEHLLRDSYVDDVAVWQADKKCIPPYVLIHLGPTQEHRATSDRVKIEASGLTTYNCFSAARAELQAVEERILPSLISALACCFDANTQPVRFRPVDRHLFGVATDGKIISDIRFTARGSGYSSTALSQADISFRLTQSISIAPEINIKVARFLHLALMEDDPLKKFLYFFLAIEIETHAVFASIDHDLHLTRLTNNSIHAPVAGQALFREQRKKLVTLKDRFIWCVLCVWSHLSDTDVEEFQRLKRIRDEIAHGSLSEPPADAVRAASHLASRLQLRSV